MINLKKIYMGVLLVSSLSLAEGFSGYVGGAVGHYEVKDNFEDHSNNHTIYSLDTKPKTYDRYLALPSMDLNYYGFYFKTEFQDGFGLKGGYSWGEDSSVFILENGFGIEQSFGEDFTFKVKQTKDDMYVNPYTLINRTTKEATTNSLELEFELAFLEIEYKYEDVNIDDEVNSDAKQSGVSDELSIMAYVIPFSDSIFGGLGLYGGKGDFDGDSNDYSKLGYKYAMQMELGKHQLQLELATAKYDFDMKNSYFNQKRDEKEKAFKLIYMQQNFLDMQKVFLNAVYVHESIDSNIDFFDKKMKAVLFNVGYAF